MAIDDAANRLRTAWLAIRRMLWLCLAGAAITISISWGCILWHVYIGAPYLRSGAFVQTTNPAWPLKLAIVGSPPAGESVEVDFGFRRSTAAHTLHQQDDGLWVDHDAFISRLNQEVDRELESARANTPASPPLTPEAIQAARHERALRFETILATEASRHRRFTDSASRWEMLQVRAGWPWLSMEARSASRTPPTAPIEYLVGVSIADPSDKMPPWRALIDRGVRWQRATGTPSGPAAFTLPLRPVWPAFAVNSAFWAMAIWIASLGLIAWRERRRLGVGQCPRCRYQVNDLPVCPECGMPNASAAQ